MNNSRELKYYIYSNEVRKKNGVFNHMFLYAISTIFLTFFPSVLGIYENYNFITNPNSVYYILLYYIISFVVFFKFIRSCFKKKKLLKIAYAIDESGNILQIIATSFFEPYRSIRSKISAIISLFDMAKESLNEMGFMWKESDIKTIINDPNESVIYKTIYHGEVYEARAKGNVIEILQIYECKKYSKKIKIICDYKVRNTGKIKKNRKIVIYRVYENQLLLEEHIFEKANISDKKTINI